MTNKPIRAKSRKGTISLFLEDVNGIKPQRVFRVREGNFTAIPADYAESMYAMASVQKLIKTQQLILEGGNELAEKVQEEGYMKKEEPIDREKILKVLVGTSPTAVKKLFSEEDPILAQVALEVARENVQEMRVPIIKIVEEITQSSILVEEE